MKISREELYDLVWKEPMITVCKRFGISDNGLRKHCKKMNIPTPPLGYWAKLKHGKPVKVVPLPKDNSGKKQNTELQEVDPTQIVNLSPAISREKERELEIMEGDISCFKVPDVLYATDPIIIDTKERARIEQDNAYLRKNPYKNKVGPTLDVSVAKESLDRVLSIFWTIIKSLRSRGHDIRIKDSKTYALINNEKIQINITERKRRNPESDEPRNNMNNIFCGELHFNIFWEYRESKIFKDTATTRLEDKIISIIATLEVRSEKIKEERIEEERRRIIREREERERKEFERDRNEEKNEFLALFTMAERLHKTNILRQYIRTYEEFINKQEWMTEEVAEKIQWAKDKADWLDPFLSKEDKYMDHYNKNEILSPECPNKNPWNYSGYSGSSKEYSFWSSPYRKWG